MQYAGVWMDERTVTQCSVLLNGRKRAAKCERLADEAQTPERRDGLLALARKWAALAQETERVDQVPADDTSDLQF
jgi:hypothetical protein